MATTTVYATTNTTGRGTIKVSNTAWDRDWETNNDYN